MPLLLSKQIIEAGLILGVIKDDIYLGWQNDKVFATKCRSKKKKKTLSAAIVLWQRFEGKIYTGSRKFRHAPKSVLLKNNFPNNIFFLKINGTHTVLPQFTF